MTEKKENLESESVCCKECGTRDLDARLELCLDCSEWVCWEHRKNEKFGIYFCEDCYNKRWNEQNSPSKDECQECGSSRDLKRGDSEGNLYCPDCING
ncbi:hypothetical protein [endosymbiont GvMRE of Glomus versiforme]|uniref:hypothetical protein n=1 Tax=endosymbiont GvMRE of Glomus versiforme TaxID=2039283 RepID=UPI000EBAE02D|nr:hypothetical protein [endosymbiont GvMRE of Glomus versiforme]RHZ36076.1 hypothetical protein GvMRE_Ic3g138 [endosymbiont GvMRE of Glomus versiforme]